ILVQDKVVIKKLAEDSTSGGWVAGADFAVIVLADPQLGFHLIDSGRAVQDMQLAAWDQGVISGLYTGFKEDRMRREFAIPNELKPTEVVGRGYPTVNILAKKNLAPLSGLSFGDRAVTKFKRAAPQEHPA